MENLSLCLDGDRNTFSVQIILKVNRSCRFLKYTPAVVVNDEL